MYKKILFDLDGTLLPMDQDEFTNGYFKFLAAKMANYGYDPEKLIDSIWKGTFAMMKNDGSCSNEAAFWRTYAGIYGEESLKDMPHYEDFYLNDFQQAKMFCGVNQKAIGAVHELQREGYGVVLATSPIFPAIATESRIRWAGLEPSDFELITTYENIGCSKPNPKYFTEVARRIGAAPGDCLMVGNDVYEDMSAVKVGMGVFLLTDCLLNRKNDDISLYPHGDFEAMMKFIHSC
ncbi:MAG: HAD hydrolase-like protein [Clostridiales bacterium]|nr:HAD hydrolase-like protein [Clostridiales bacterium]